MFYVLMFVGWFKNYCRIIKILDVLENRDVWICNN